MDTWGIVSTIKAPAIDILRFAAFHLEAGAHRIFICLDEPSPGATPLLEAHPKIRLTQCDDAYWRKVNGKRPDMHQPRQTVNATQIYRKATDVDWLIHMDVDEFLLSDQPIVEHLAKAPKGTQTARCRPMELLAGSADAFKRFIPAGPDRERIVAELYPTFGEHLKGGFLSHLAGKIFVATGMGNIKFRIHKALQDDVIELNEFDLEGVDLAHCHAQSWENWQSRFEYRLNEGSYRASLGPGKSRKRGGISMHELFHALIEEEGVAGLRAFYDEVCADSEALRQRLVSHGLLTVAPLNLDATLSKHFPDFTG